MIFFINVLLFSTEPITPIPLKVDFDTKKAKLGKELFFDPILSKTNNVSCHSCHLFEQGGTDNLRFSVGVDGKMGNVNSPTVFNSVFNFSQFWDGRAKDLKEQAIGPITNPVEMDMTFAELITKLNKTSYVEKFKNVYEDGITEKNIIDAIAEYEKTLITPNAPFDMYLRGDENAVSEEVKKGYQLFKEQGCIACHHGINIGGNSYQKFGSLVDVESDVKGRFDITNNKYDEYHFKVPTLRNIELTAPYLHDGRLDNLEETVKFMSYYQLGKSLTQEEINNIIAFLKSLTGQMYTYENQ